MASRRIERRESSSLRDSRSLTGIHTMRLNMQGGSSLHRDGDLDSQSPEKQKGDMESAEQRQRCVKRSEQGKVGKGDRTWTSTLVVNSLTCCVVQ